MTRPQFHIDYNLVHAGGCPTSKLQSTVNRCQNVNMRHENRKKNKQNNQYCSEKKIRKFPTERKIIREVINRLFFVAPISCLSIQSAFDLT